jgi:Icc-related predicted phosphoesterase
MQEFCKENGIHYLAGGAVDINGLVIGGTGMWYNTPKGSDVDFWKRTMNDSSLIMTHKPQTFMYGYGASTTMNGFDTQEFYLSEVEKLKSIGKVDVLMTHVCPIIIPDRYMPREYHGDPANMFYSSDNSAIIKSINPEIVIFGHTHDQYDMTVDGTWFACNPLGYKGEKSGNEILQIEIVKD